MINSGTLMRQKQKKKLLLDLVVTLLDKVRNTNQVRVEVHMDNKDILRRISTTTKVANHCNQDPVA